MKRIVALVVLMLFFCSLTSCSAAKNSKNNSEREELAAYENFIEKELTLSYVSNISKYRDSFSVTLKTDDVTLMGNAIIEALETCEKLFPPDEWSLSIAYYGGNKEVQLLYSFGIGEYGTIMDKRSGVTVVTTFNSVGDLCAFFPETTY